MTDGINFKGTHIVHILKIENRTWCGMDTNRAPHADIGVKRKYTLVPIDGLKCQSDISMYDKQPEHTLCTRCNMWRNESEKK
jgi:hypothetical protein